MSETDYSDLEKEIPVDDAEAGLEEVAELPAPVDWLHMSVHEWREEIGRLRLWVGQITTEWALPASVILPCWEQHADIVQVLGSLRDAYDTLYHEEQPGTGAVDWQRYWSWARSELASMTGSLRCTATEHHAPRLQEWAREIAEDGESSSYFQAEDERVTRAVENHVAKGRASGALNVMFVDFTKGQ